MSRGDRTIAMAGATGFVGQALRDRLVGQYRVRGLTRSPRRAMDRDATGVEWRACDLFSTRDTERALEGADVAVYLVHSMHPSARLVQASFMDLDLLLADNFARAAESAGVQHILYLGGIRPQTDAMSRHLASRLEVERTLGARSVPVTTLRAGLIVGPGGSSLSMMVNLVRRLPVMLLPSWTRSKSAPVAIADVLRALERCIEEPRWIGGTFEIGGPEVLSYREMLERTGKVLGRHPLMIDVPVFSPYLSQKWVSWVAGAHEALAGPLIESLRHSMVPTPNDVQAWLEPGLVPFEDALRRSLGPSGRSVPNPRASLRRSDDATLRSARTVRSVQRLPLPKDRRASWVATEYMRWLPRFVWPFLRCVNEEGRVRFHLRGTNIVLLELTHAPERSTADRQLFRITGGALARIGDSFRGRFEFREVLCSEFLIAAIHDFRPRLPWLVYNATQALVHLWVMRSFGRHLSRGGRPAAERELEAPSSIST
ncbi:MAG: NAD(P)H-binding protein [Myxococcales bacterium]|nr:NAD(P)H-binding protein [Myxococcales bacterium]